MLRMHGRTSGGIGVSGRWVIGLSLAFVVFAVRPGQAQQEPGSYRPLIPF